MDDIIGKGLEWYVTAELLFYTSITLIPRALPLAVLLSCIMTYGNLSERYEMVAMRAAGIPIRKTLQPLFFVMVALSFTTFFVYNNLIPKASLKAGALLWDVRQLKPSVSIREGEFYNDIDGYSIRVNKKENDGETIRDIIIYEDVEQRGNTNVTTAESGTMKMSLDKRYLVITLYNGHQYKEMIDNVDYYRNRQHNSMDFEKQQITLDLTDFEITRTREELFRDDYRMKTLAQLLASIDSLDTAINKKYNNLGRYLTPYFHLNLDKEMVAKQKIERDSLDSIAALTPDTAFRVQMSEADTNFKKALLPPGIRGTKPDIITKPPPKLPHEYEKKQATIDGKYNDSAFITNFPEDKRVQIFNSAINNAILVKNIIDNSHLELRNVNKSYWKHKMEVHRKFALPLALIILFFIGAPMGTIIRRGGLGMPMVVSVIFFLIYYVVNLAGEKAVKGGGMPEWEGAWLSSIVLIPMAIVITYMAATDSKIFKAETYYRIKYRLKKRFKKSEDITSIT